MKLQRIAVIAMMAAFLTTMGLPAEAFGLFGLRLFGPKEAKQEEIIGEPQYYTAELNVGGDDELVSAAVNDASQLMLDKDQPASGAAGLIAKARGDYQRILAALYSEGYYGSTISIRIDGREAGELPPDAELSSPAVVIVTVKPGTQFRFRETIIQNRALPPVDPDDEVEAPEDEGFVPGEVARAGVIKKAGRLSIEAWRQQGHAKAELAERRVVAAHDSSEIDAILTLSPGKKAYYGPVTVEGEERMDPGFIAYMTGIREGEEYDPDDLKEAEERLALLDVFASARAVEDERIGPGGALPISFIVQERLPRRFGIGGTLSTVDGAGVEAFWQHRNLHGKAERLRVEGKVSGIGNNSTDSLTYRVGVAFLKPGVFTPLTNFESSVTGIREVLDLYTRKAVIAEAGFTHRFSKEVAARMMLNVSHARFTDGFGRREFFTAGFSGALTYDNRDDPRDAKNGFFAEFTIEPFHEFRFNNTGVKSTLEGRMYAGLDKQDRFVLAGRLKFGMLAGVPIAQAPPDKLFFAGGGGSVRGYGYRNIGIVTPTGLVTGGRSLVEGSAEIRARVTDTIGVVGFIDFGSVTATTFPDFSRPFQVGVGAGIRYLTGLGPVRLDIAVPLNPRPGDPTVAAYVGIGQAF